MIKACRRLTSGLLAFGLSASGILCLTLANPAMADSLWPQPYDASYDIKTARGVMPMRMLSNGKGMVRTDISNGSGRGMSVSIIDYPNKTMYTIVTGSNTILKGPPTGNTGQKMDKEEAKRLNATDLGSKMVNNHMCQGWSYKTEDGTRELWYDNEAGLTVKAITTARGQTTEMNLKSTTSNPPPDSVFQVPTRGYKVVDISTAQAGRQMH